MDRATPARGGRVAELHAADLRGQAGIVTGAASGIGRATAIALAGQGVSVLCLDREDPGPTTAEVERRGGVALAMRADITDEDEVRASVARCTESFGGLDLAVNAAGVVDFEPLETLELDHWQRQLAVNLTGPMLLLKHTLPVMHARGAGAAVLVGSIAGRTGGIQSGPSYGAAKGGVHALVRWAAAAYAPHRVRVNAIAPGPVDTPMIAGRGYERAAIPLGRFGRPEEIAAAAIYLVSAAAAWVTGQVIDINGGILGT